MSMSATTSIPSKTLLSGWERILLAVPAVAGLGLGLFPLLLPALFAQVSLFPGKNFYLYQLAGAATLGYGVALAIGLFQRNWLPVRLPVIGVLVFNLASLYACGVRIFTEANAPYSIYVVLAASLLLVAISSLLLVRHQGVPRQGSDLASPTLRIFFVVGAVAAGVFGILPLLVPGLFANFHLVSDPDIFFLARQAGAASLGYAVIAVLAQSALNTRELPLAGAMAAVFNGVSAIVSIPYLFSGEYGILPFVIAPFGLLVLVICLLVFRQFIQKSRAGASSSQAN